MSYSIQKLVSDGTLSVVVLGVEYLQRNDIYMRIAGVETPQSGAPSGYTWSFVDNSTLRILPVVPVGVEVTVYRRTDFDRMYNVYSQNAQFDESTIDENNQQLLYIAQEYFEQGIPGASIEALEYVRATDDGYYYRFKLTDGSYTPEFLVPISHNTKLSNRAMWTRFAAESGYVLAAGDFETGGVLLNNKQVLLDESTQGIYSWSGAYPVGGKVVAAGTDPVVAAGYVPRTDVGLRSELAADTGYTLVPSVQIQQWKDQGDIRGWGGDIQATIDSNRIMRKTTKIPAGAIISSPLTVYDYTHISGDGVDSTVLTLVAASNQPLILSDGANALWGTQSLGGVRGVVIENLTIDGNKASNSLGSGIALYGFNPRLSNVKIINCGKNALRTEWAGSGNATGGMEGTFENLILDTSGEDGWRFAGPHDSVCHNIIIISSGQKTASTFSGLWIERGNARWSGVHIWTNANDLRSKCALRIDRAAEGNEFTLSHFEGADTNVDIHANNTTLDETCKVYYPWNANNIVLHGSSCRIKCYVGEEYKGIGLPLANGVTFTGTYGGVSGSEIDIIGNGLVAGPIYFGASGGYNTVKIRGYSASPSTVGVGGTPAATDMVDVVVSGGNAVVYKKDVAMTRAPVVAISGAGSTQSDATQIGSNYASVLINAGSVSSGVKLPNTTIVGNGAVITVFNGTEVGINVYPSQSQDILGLGVNNPLVLLPLKSAQFTVVDSSNGKWTQFKGA